MKLLSRLMCVLMLSVLACPVVAQDIKWSAGEKPEEVIAYKKTDKGDLMLHIFRPEGDRTTPRPCIVLFFGGGWNGGTPAQFYTQSRYLTTHGMVAISAQYRTRGSHGVEPKICVEDGRSAIRYVREHAAELGVKPNMIAAGGGSAGGHVAAATATATKFDSPEDDMNISAVPNALVLFNPVYDNGPDGFDHDRVKAYYKDFSPLHLIYKGMPPTIVLLGDKDKLIPVATAEKFKQLMTDNGDRSELFVYEGQSHGFFNLRKSRDGFIATVTETHKFLASLGYLEGDPTVEQWVATKE